MDTVTSAVKKLSLELCPKCKGGKTQQRWTAKMGYNELCSACGGSGGLVPGLRKPCPGQRKRGRVFPCGYHPDSGKTDFICPTCKGDKEVLVPEAEQMGVLVRYRPEIQIELDRLSNGEWMANGFIDTTPEEAWAAALLQVLEVE